MYDLSTIKYMNGTSKYKKMIDRRVRIIKIKEWFKKKLMVLKKTIYLY